jgi:hypothetical protein
LKFLHHDEYMLMEHINRKLSINTDQKCVMASTKFNREDESSLAKVE